MPGHRLADVTVEGLTRARHARLCNRGVFLNDAHGRSSIADGISQPAAMQYRNLYPRMYI